MDGLPNEVLDMILQSCDHMARRVCALWKSLMSELTHLNSRISVRDMILHDNYAELLTWAFQNGCPKTRRLYMICMHHERWEVFAWLRTTHNVCWDSKICNKLTLKNHDMLVWAVQQGIATDNRTFYCMVQSHDPRTVELLLSMGVKFPFNNSTTHGIHTSTEAFRRMCEYLPVDSKHMKFIARNAVLEGDMDKLQLLADMHIPLVIRPGDRIGTQTLTDWIHTHGRADLIRPVPYDYILQGGHLHLLKLFASRTDFDANVCLQNLCEHHRSNPAMLNVLAKFPELDWTMILQLAITSMDPKIITWLHEHRYPWHTKFHEMLPGNVKSIEVHRFFCFIDNVNRDHGELINAGLAKRVDVIIEPEYEYALSSGEEYDEFSFVDSDDY